MDREKLRFSEPQHRCQLLAREHLLCQRHFSHLSKCNNRKYYRFSRTSERPLTEHRTGHHAASGADCDTNYSRCSTSHYSGPCSATNNGADTDHCYPYATAKISEFNGQHPDDFYLWLVWCSRPTLRYTPLRVVEKYILRAKHTTDGKV